MLLVRREAFDAVGGFDAGYFLYGEDLDLCRRLGNAGWSLIAVPEVWAVHESGGSAESTLSRELHWWRGTMQYAARWWNTADWMMGLVAATVRMGRMLCSHPKSARVVASSLLVQPMLERLRQRSSLGVRCGTP